MKKLILVFAFLLITVSSIYAQSSVNEYKYVIVPERFDFLKANDQFKLNSLTKFLLEKKNFLVFMDNNMPKELIENRCMALFTKVSKRNNLFNTKLKVQLLDCYNNVVIESNMGASREKDFQKAYHEALRNAFKSLSVDYTYTPKEAKEDELEVVAVTPKPEPQEIKIKKEVEPKTETKIVKETVNVVKDTPVKKPIVKSEEIIEVKKPSNILYAQPIAEGFQLVDNTPKVVMILLETAKKDVFIVKGQDAIVYKENSKWYVSKNSNDSKLLEIKF